MVVANQVRASDAVHVATALIILRDAPDVAFLTADRRQANAATAEGLTVIFVGD